MVATSELAMRKTFLICSLASLAATPALAAPWVRGFAVENYEPAFYYGAKLGGTEAPGSDCPKGTNPDNDYAKLFKAAGYKDAEVAEMLKPLGNVDLDPDARPGQDAGLGSALAHRGFRKDIESYINPFAAPDPGMQQVTGTIAEGFNLDNNAKTGGFTSPSGEKGVDNAFYRAWGCLMSYRGTPYHAFLSQRGNDKMVDGLYTMVIRVSGTKDPMNDDNVTLEIAYSPDHVVKDPNGHVVADYSYRMVKSEQYTKLKAHIRNGVLESEQGDLHLPAFSWGETNRGEALFQKGKIRFRIKADGTMEGLAGGYRDWRDIYGHDTFNAPSDGQTRETFYHQNQIGMYYALKRNADGLTDPKTGENMGISAAYRFIARPAYVIDPAKPAAVDEPPYPTGAHALARRAAFMKASVTKQIAADPPNNRRGNRPSATPKKDLQADATPAAPPATVASTAPATAR
jgi:hypothetical protein